MSKRVYLLRHAEPDHEYTRRFLGRLDPDLSPNGVRQANRIAKRICPLQPERCFSSPLRRARSTADIIASQCGLEVETDDSLLEIDFGQMEGLTFKEAASRYPDITDSWQALSQDFCFPGGESFSGFNARAAKVAAMLRESQEKSTLLIAHGGILRGVLCNLLGVRADGPLRFRLAYAALTTLEVYDGGTAAMTGFNVGTDLDGLGLPPA